MTPPKFACAVPVLTLLLEPSPLELDWLPLQSCRLPALPLCGRRLLLARRGERSARTHPGLCQAKRWAGSTPARQRKSLNCITMQHPVISPTKHQMKTGKLKSSSDGKCQDSTSVATGKSYTIFLWYKYLAWSLNTYRKILRYTVRKGKKKENCEISQNWDYEIVSVSLWQHGNGH